MEVEWDENCWEPKVERVVLVYHKTDVLDLQAFLQEKFNLWAGNSSCVEEIWKRCKDITFKVIKCYIPKKKILSKNPCPEYYNKEVKQLKVKVRKIYNKRKFGQPYQADLKRLSKELLVAKKKAQDTFLRSILQTKSVAGRSSVSMLSDVKEIEKTFRKSRIIMGKSSQIKQKRKIP